MINAEEHTLYRIRNARILPYPFPHFYIEGVFPFEFYWELRKNLPKLKDLKKSTFDHRYFGPEELWGGLDFMKTPHFMNAVMMAFYPWVRKRYPGEARICTDLRLVYDEKGYAIGPHTDAPWKLVSLLFYLPEDGLNPDAGTSIYAPKTRGFKCQGGPHYDHDQFHLVETMNYYPNSVFGFWKTDSSFHGVETIKRVFPRWVLLYNIHDEELFLKSQEKPDGNVRCQNPERGSGELGD